MSILYNIAIALYGFAIKVVSLFNPKAKKWVDGRKNWDNKLQQFIETNNREVIWVHAASLGEFEQGRPLIEELAKKNLAIALTFFSPSGYEVRKNYDKADYIAYLPLDTKGNATRFLEILKPKAAFFVKYEFWLNYLNALEKKEIPHYLISGIFRESQPFFRPYGGVFRKRLSGFGHLFVQSESDKKLLSNIGIDQVTVTGDTRFDRVFQVKSMAKSIPDIEAFAKGQKTVIVGSSWPKEEELIGQYINDSADDDLRFIIAPHDIHQDRIEKLMSSINKPCEKYSQSQGQIKEDTRFLIIDSIGLLSSIYQFGDVTIIGGGFEAGLHNTLEAAVWGQPLIIGPKYEKFQEANDLVALEVAHVVHNYVDFEKKLTTLLSDDELRNSLSAKAASYCEQRAGATSMILDEVKELQVRNFLF